MTNRDVDRIKVINSIIEGRLTWNQAARQLRLSERQIGSLVLRVRQEGHRGIIHHLRGRPSNNQLDPKLKKRALTILRDPLYEGFGPTLAQEKLGELHKIAISISALRQGMTAGGLWQPNQGKIRHRAWRPRRMCLGEMIQLDGSYHHWFEGRGPKCALIAYIDDATSRILQAEFVQGEDTMTLMRLTKAYLLDHGRPVSLYVDKHGVYKVNDKYALTEPILRDDTGPLTQFGRAMAELNIEVIWAHSPQAKGRVERAFETLQDRLIKEMRLKGISSVAQANRFLWEEFIPFYNRRFGKPPASPSDAHRPLLASQNLDDILALKTQRRVMNDFTVRFKNRFLQITKNQPVIVKPKDKVTVIVRLDGSTYLEFKGYKLNFKPIAKGIFQGRELIKERSFFHQQPQLKLPILALAGSPWQVSLRFEELKAAQQQVTFLQRP